MPIYLHNTLTRRKEALQPLKPDHVGMYVCGPTVYDFAHIGNARPVVVFDVLYRLLKLHFKSVTYVRNITDIEDKIIAAAAKNGEPISTLTARTEQAYREDMTALNALAPDHEPRATEHVAGMQRIIAALIDKGHAYVADGHVLFFGRIHPDKGTHTAIDIARAAGQPIRIAGIVHDDRYFTEQVAPRLGDDAEYVGPVGGARRAAELGSATALLHPVAFDEPFEEMRVPVEGGSLDALLFRQPDPRGLVFYLHGNRGNLTTWTTGLELYQRANVDFFVFDYRGYGRSVGANVDEAQLDADVRAAWDTIAPRYAGKPIAIIGRSLGSGLAVQLMTMS